MPEHEYAPGPGGGSLLSLIDDLEQGFETLSDSLERLRATVRTVAEQVRNQEQPGMPVAPSLTIVPSESPAVEADAATSQPVEDSFSWPPSRLEEVALSQDQDTGSEETPAPASEAPATQSPSAEPKRANGLGAVEAARDDLTNAAASESARDEVRRAVEATRAELSWSNLRVDSGFSFAPTQPLEDASAGSQPPLEARETPPAAASDEDLRREEVRRAVEAARSAMSETPAPAVDPEEARREEVRLAVERARAEMTARPETPAADDDEARREEVRRMVENTRGALSWNTMKSDSGSWGQFQPEPGGFSIRADQAPPASLDRGDPGQAEETDSEEARREEVRRAVEAARAEMEGPAEDAAPRIVPIVPRPGTAMPKGADFSGPPLIVIEDPSGRVELSQVFATLSRVDKSAQAALLNYSPHSVTIGLGVLSPMPDANELVLAAQAVFGRACTAKTEGNRTSIEVGTHRVG